MRSHRRSSSMVQRSSLIPLSAIVLTSAAILPLASADDSMLLTRGASLQVDRGPRISEPHSHSQDTKQQSRLPVLAYNPPPADLDRNLDYDRFAQRLRFQHKPPPANLPSRRPSETIDDEDEDDEPRPRPTNPDYQPVPTKWLMLGYSNVADIPAGRSPETMSGGNQRHRSYPASASTSAEHSVNDVITPGEIVQHNRSDWIQSPAAQIMGALTVFLVLVLIIESSRYIWRVIRPRRAVRHGSGRLTLEGDEKQLLAFADDDRPKS